MIQCCLIDEVRTAIESLPPSHLHHPEAGEVFANPEECFERLQNFAMSQGFVVVQRSKERNKRYRWQCIHHGEKTANKRGLEDHVERDPSGEAITSQRKREHTTVKQKNCKWLVGLTYKPAVKGSDVKTWQLYLGEQSHSHDMVPNPLSYYTHQQRMPTFQKAIERALAHRQASLTYSQSARVLAAEGLDLPRKSYYNISRPRGFSKLSDSDDNVKDLLAMLDREQGLIYRARYDYEVDGTGKPVAKILDQLFWMTEQQRTFSRKFISNFLLQLDATFSTNKLGMLLIEFVGINHHEKSFPAAYSYCISESKVAFDFAIDAFLSVCFGDDEAPEPRVILSDQAEGLMVSLPIQIPGAVSQLCEWHAVQNIRAHCLKAKYSKKERDAIHDLSWKYIQAGESSQAVEEARLELYQKLTPASIKYMDERWVPKENRVVRYYTKGLANLGCYTTQRVESMHPVTKQLLNRQLPLDEAIKRIIDSTKLKLREIIRDEGVSRIASVRVLDRGAFVNVAGKISINAIQRIEKEWEIAKSNVDNSCDQYLCVGDCEATVRFGLPCSHKLMRAAIQGIGFPISLVHPRWWLDGPEFASASWEPRYYDETIDLSAAKPMAFRDTRLNKLTKSVTDLLTTRDQLDEDQKARFDEIWERSHVELSGVIQHARDFGSHIPKQMPLPAKSDYNPRKFKSHDKTAKRDMTAVEALERDAAREEKRVQKDSKTTEPSGLQAKEVVVPETEENNRMEEATPEVRHDIETLQVTNEIEQQLAVNKADGKKRRRAPTIDYKQLAGLETRKKRSKEEILKEKLEKEARSESKAKKTRRVHAEIQEGWEDLLW